MKRRTFLTLAAAVPGLWLTGCGGSKTLLSPKDPTMLSIWHVYGEQTDSPMNRLLTEFNDTVGKEKGVLLNVTNMTNSAVIGSQLQEAQSGKPGALDLPDLFSAHPADAEALGVEKLVDWNDWFSAEEMAAFVPGFVQDGVIAGKQIVFPVSKSTQLLFLNGSQYARFAADTGAQLEKLDTWDGFFEMAAAYRQWSQGKPFCALDSPFPQQSYQRLYDVYNQMRPRARLCLSPPWWATMPAPRCFMTSCASARSSTPSGLRTGKRWMRWPRRHGNCCARTSDLRTRRKGGA